MPIGQAEERDNLRDSTRIERDSLMRTRSTDTIMASGLEPRATGRTHELNLTRSSKRPPMLLLNGGRPHMNHIRPQRGIPFVSTEPSGHRAGAQRRLSQNLALKINMPNCG